MSCNPLHKATKGCSCNPPIKKRSTVLFYFFGVLFFASILVAFNVLKGYEVQALSSQNILLIVVLGFLTGLHCIGMCGGFMMSYMRYGKQRGLSTFQMHFRYAFSKIVSYSIFGALFGFLGSFITITTVMKSVASLCGGIFLIYIGAKAFGLFSKLKKYSFAKKAESSNSKWSNPIIIGLLKGFMVSCAPLQALYLLSAAIGSPLKGALMLAVFGIGTLPIFLTYGIFLQTLNKIKTQMADIITASIIIVFGVLMINRGLNLTGHDFKNMAFFDGAKNTPTKLFQSQHMFPQLLEMEANAKGWSKKEISYTYGQKIRWEIYVSKLTVCNKTIEIPALGIKQDLKEGLNIIEFEPGMHQSLIFTCWMGMLNGKLISK